MLEIFFISDDNFTYIGTRYVGELLDVSVHTVYLAQSNFCS